MSHSFSGEMGESVSCPACEVKFYTIHDLSEHIKNDSDHGRKESKIIRLANEERKRRRIDPQSPDEKSQIVAGYELQAEAFECRTSQSMECIDSFLEKDLAAGIPTSAMTTEQEEDYLYNDQMDIN